MSKRTIEADTTEETEKKQRPTVYAPEFFHSNEIQKATVKIGRQYKANDNKTRFITPAVIGANNIEFMSAKDPWGPDRLVLVYPPPSASAKERLTLRVHRKTAEAKEYRVVYQSKGQETESRHIRERVPGGVKWHCIERRFENQEIEMTAKETNDSFTIEGPDFELEIKGKRRSNPQLAAIAKERELIAKVLLIRKEYEETVLPHLPASIQFTGAMVLGSLLPSVTVELRKGQLEDAEKQLASQ